MSLSIRDLNVLEPSDRPVTSKCSLRHGKGLAHYLSIQSRSLSVDCPLKHRLSWALVWIISTLRDEFDISC